MKPGYYKHVDGGIYFLIMIANDAATDNEVAVYEHIWPFFRGSYVRSRTEFENRFTKVEDDEAMTFMAMSFEETAYARDMIQLSKKRRRAREAKQG